MNDCIIIRGARENNLKNICLDIPKGKVVTFTGVSGSGKSTLAFQVIFSESQRRYLDSISHYARRFLYSYSKPDVDLIEGLSPSIAITQRSLSKNPRSTVATLTEIYDYMRVLYAKIGIRCFISSGHVVTGKSKTDIYNEIMDCPYGSLIKAMIRCPEKLKNTKTYESFLKAGNVMEDSGECLLILSSFILVKDNALKIKMLISNAMDLGAEELVLKFLSIGGTDKNPPYKEGDIQVIKLAVVDSEDVVSEHELHPKLFSFNCEKGACSGCNGIGKSESVDKNKVIGDVSMSVNQGVILPLGSLNEGSYVSHASFQNCRKILTVIFRHYGFDCNEPWESLPEKAKNIVLYGTSETIQICLEEGGSGAGTLSVRFEGILNLIDKISSGFGSVKNYMSIMACKVCNGRRLNKRALSVFVGGKNISDLTAMSVDCAKEWFENIGSLLSARDLKVAERLIEEIMCRLNFLQNVGLGYVALSRESSGLSGGENQRVRIASQLGSGLTGITYILDEPSVGLHPNDNVSLMSSIRNLQKNGNTLIVIEHDEETILNSDYIVDIGPGAGELNGGRVVCCGTPEDIKNSTESITGGFLSGRLYIPLPPKRRKITDFIMIRGADVNNLKNFTAVLPLKCFSVVTGVSGAGKSTFVGDVLYNKAVSALKVPPYLRFSGFDQIDNVLSIDQSPIGRTPASNPATYVGLFNHIRNLYASLEESKAAGYGVGHFSFNTKHGRCEVCNGDGMLKSDMFFLPDIYIVCDTCNGSRYNDTALAIKYKNKSVAEVLAMSVSEALEFFKDTGHLIVEKLKSLNEVGLGYIKLGQSATTLSGGEAQRIKLSKELSKYCAGNTLYILDEPTTGLHSYDIRILLNVLHRLVDKGNTLVVVEHNLHVIKTCDYVIDFGPVGGELGGYIVAAGTPEEIVENENSVTGPYLKQCFENRQDK